MCIIEILHKITNRNVITLVCYLAQTKMVMCQLLASYLRIIKTHDSELRGQEEAGRTRDEQVSYLHVAPL